MPLPASWTTVPVTGTYLATDGTPCTGQIVFVSPQIVIVDSTVVVPKKLVFDLDENGHFEAAVPATNDTDLDAAGWAYTVVEAVQPTARAPYLLIVPYDSAGIDLATATPAEPVPSARPAYQLQIGTVDKAIAAAASFTDISPGVQALNLTLPKGDQGDPATNLVQSVFGRIGAVAAKAGDYTFDLIGGLPTTLAGYGINDAAPLSHVGAGGDAHALATGTTAGFLSSADKAKLDALAPVASSGDYNALNNLPVLGTAAAKDIGFFALASQAGAADGLAQLGSDGKLLSGQIPTVLLGQMDPMGPWDASAGTPPSATPTKGQYWIVTTAGSTDLGGITDWGVGDWAIYDDTVGWYKCDNTDAVSVVAGLTGAISAASLRTALSIDQVDNTADVDKPVSTAQQAAFDLKLDKTANAASASKLATARTITLGGLVGGAAAFDGSGDITIQVTMADGALAIAKTAGLQAALDDKLAASDLGAADGAGSLNSAGVAPVTERRTPIKALGNVTGAVTIDFAAGGIFTMTLTGDITITWANLPAAGLEAEAVLRITQDATGAHAITWPAGTLWPGGYAYTGGSAAGAMDEVGLSIDSTGAARGYPVEGFA